MKKIFLLIFLALLVAIPALYFESGNIYSYIYKSGSFISIKELKGTDQVFIDGKNAGKTPLLSYKIPSGEHEIKVEKSSNSSDYFVFDKKLSFEDSTNTYINLELGPNPTYSFYEIFSQYKNPKGSGIMVKPLDYTSENPSITIGNETISSNTFKYLTSGSYNLTYNENGYVTASDKITINNGYMLIDSIHPFKQPL